MIIGTSMGSGQALGSGFQLEQLAKAFDRVRNPHDWKAAIQAEIVVADRQVVERAITWFTATVPRLPRFRAGLTD